MERTGKANPNTKFWGIWLPVPTIIAIIVTLFFNWLILQTVGYTEDPIEKAGEHIIEEF
ncbi:MAG: hypothetical protein ACYCV0_08425 [Desulfitobacteriaceae bacterium]